MLYDAPARIRTGITYIYYYLWRWGWINWCRYDRPTGRNSATVVSISSSRSDAAPNRFFFFSYLVIDVLHGDALDTTLHIDLAL